jgi:[protein-PII] uridylyltransferase
VHRAATAIAGDELPPPALALLSSEHRSLMSEVRRRGPGAQPVLIADGSRVTVLAPDQPGLLASVTGVLCLHGLDLRSADVAGEDRVALDVFVVEPAHGRWPDWDQVTTDLEMAIAGRLDLDALLAKRAAAYERSTPRRVRIDVRVAIDNTASRDSTVVEVRAADVSSLLHRVTSTLFARDLDVVAARACTLGDEVVDAFYVRDRSTRGKVQDPERLRELSATLQNLLGGSPDTE